MEEKLKNMMEFLDDTEEKRKEKDDKKSSESRVS